jgi:hypothetical protein
MKLKSKEIFEKSPGKGVAMSANSCYTRRDGLDKVCYRSTETRDDITDTIERRFSTDNGKTWGPWESISFIELRPGGVHRKSYGGGFLDPNTDRLVDVFIEGTLPSDMPLEGMKHWYCSYRVSSDGGRTYPFEEQVIQKGHYTPEHPCEGVWVGKNSIMACNAPLVAGDGRLLVPIQITPVGPSGEYHNPGGGYSYHEAGLLIGTWKDDLKIEWDLSEMVKNDPAKSTRGCVEPTIAEMPDGRFLMVMRGSNQKGGEKEPKIPGYKWFSVSEDGCRTWTKPAVWTYTDGQAFNSPSSISLLERHSSGKYYWFGNITESRTVGNSPRHPLQVGEVDPESLLLKKEGVMIIDDVTPQDDPALQLSNFSVHEDRETADFILHMTRFMERGRDNWQSDACIYRIET